MKRMIILILSVLLIGCKEKDPKKLILGKWKDPSSSQLIFDKDSLYTNLGNCKYELKGDSLCMLVPIGWSVTTITFAGQDTFYLGNPLELKDPILRIK
ncbi:MAG: hypothetical protein JWO03_1482 [Bacteroidetes bacterium]|nr:hypothetical protein [Bacteroidota bacterium]